MKLFTDFALFVCRGDLPLRDALGRLEAAAPHVVQIVLDADGKVVGSLTDGDIRRGILAGAEMADPVERVMRRAPLVGYQGDDTANAALVSRAEFLPIVDAHGRMTALLTLTPSGGSLRRAVVMAGGFGRRLGSLTQDTPKPLLPVGGRPILDHVLDQLEAAGVEQVHVSTHYRADQIRSFVDQRSSKARISLLHEDNPMGTAGVLRHLEPDDDPVLVMNGDVVTRVDLAAMHQFHAAHEFDCTIAVARYEVQIPYGVIRHTPDGLFAGIDEKPVHAHFVSAGIYCLAPNVLALLPASGVVDMPELINLASRDGLRVGLFPIHEYWKDVGRPGDLEAARNDHAN